jgi:competence protein ComEA
MRKSLSIIVSILILSIASAAFADDASTVAAPNGVVNINTADGAQLALLPRIGVKTAQRIVDYRTQHGAFKKTSDLMQVKGIGDKSFQRLSSYIAVEGKTTLTAKVASPRKPRSGGAKSHQPAPAAQ